MNTAAEVGSVAETAFSELQSMRAQGMSVSGITKFIGSGDSTIRIHIHIGKPSTENWKNDTNRPE